LLPTTLTALLDVTVIRRFNACPVMSTVGNTTSAANAQAAKAQIKATTTTFKSLLSLMSFLFTQNYYGAVVV
jgi:hypothetical protein